MNISSGKTKYTQKPQREVYTRHITRNAGIVNFTRNYNMIPYISRPKEPARFENF